MTALFQRLVTKRRSAAPLGARSTGRSHVGRVREANEDRVLERPEVMLWAIADGMGGHSGGGEAAETLIGHLAATSEPVTAAWVDQALAAANAAILSASGGESGTTVVLAHVDGAHAHLSWAGDSRAYLIRDGQLRLLTRDHSLVQQLVDAGALTPEQAAHHPRANVITQALGTAQPLAVERASHELMRGDRLLLCSDGLSRSLGDRDVRQAETIEAQADRLLTNALQRDGSDNISLVLIEFG